MLKILFELVWNRLPWKLEKMTTTGEDENQRLASTKHFVKPLLLAQNSLHVPSHVLLPRGSLFAHPYPESVHPFETHEQLSLAELRTQTTAARNHFIFDTNTSQQSGEFTKQGQNNVYKSYGTRDEKNSAGYVKSIPVLPFKAAVVCLILNCIVPGGGKWKIVCVHGMFSSVLKSWIMLYSHTGIQWNENYLNICATIYDRNSYVSQNSWDISPFVKKHLLLLFTSPTPPPVQCYNVIILQGWEGDCMALLTEDWGRTVGFPDPSSFF